MEHRAYTVCSDCLLALTRRRAPAVKYAGLAGPSLQFLRFATRSSRPTDHQSTQHKPTHLRCASTTSKRSNANPTRQPAPQDLNAVHARVLELSGSVLKPTDGPVPAEQRVLFVLDQFEAIAKSLTNSLTNAASSHSDSATSALLGSVNTRKSSGIVNKATVLKLIAQKAEAIIIHPNVFITSSTLRTYVRLQVLLQQPETISDVFQLYANKPTPTAVGEKVRYSSPDPKSVKAAVDKDIANTALSAAISAHNLSLTMAVIETTFAAPAYTRAKLLRQGTLPGTAIAAAPLVAYGLSVQFSAWQTMLDPAHATAMAFAGFMTYVAAVGSVGYVAITSANDQMDRVTWVQGIPLWERWIREEERAALDRVASAWGFKSSEKRGDEEGEDWEYLRETCGRKGMVLDKVELMEGME